MDMVTTCPGCGTGFRIGAEQLNARQGDVRCGRCGRVFNAFDTLTTLEAPPSPVQAEAPQEVFAAPVAEPSFPPEKSETAPDRSAQWPLEEPSAASPAGPVAAAEQGAPADALLPPAESGEEVETAAAAEYPSLDEAGVPRQDTAGEAELAQEVFPALLAEPAIPAEEGPVAPAMAGAGPPEEAPGQEGVPASDAGAARAVEEVDAVALMEPPPPLAEAAPPPGYAAIPMEPAEGWGAASGSKPSHAAWRGTRRTAGWELREGRRGGAAARRWPAWVFATGSVLLVLGLGLQAAYFYRTELAARYPASKPYLGRACELLKCDIPLPRNADLLGIESSELETVDPARPAMILLRATLRNRARFVQGYPSLELSLTDAADRIIARRIFAPVEYLPQGTDPKAGLQGEGEVAIKLYMDLGDLNAVGYRLYVFYP